MLSRLTVSGELLHVFCLGASNHNKHWSQNQRDAAPTFLCWSTGRAQLKEQHNWSAAGLIEGPAAEIRLNLGSGIKLDRLIICLRNSREDKNCIRDFAWQFWRRRNPKTSSYVELYASRSGILAVRHSPWGGYHGPHGWLVSSGCAGADWSSCHSPLSVRVGGGPQGKILMVLVIKEKCCASHFSGPADTLNVAPALILSRITAGFLLSVWCLLGLHIAPVPLDASLLHNWRQWKDSSCLERWSPTALDCSS